MTTGPHKTPVGQDPEYLSADERLFADKAQTASTEDANCALDEEKPLPRWFKGYDAVVCVDDSGSMYLGRDKKGWSENIRGHNDPCHLDYYLETKAYTEITRGEALTLAGLPNPLYSYLLVPGSCDNHSATYYDVRTPCVGCLLESVDTLTKEVARLEAVNKLIVLDRDMAKTERDESRLLCERLITEVRQLRGSGKTVSTPSEPCPAGVDAQLQHLFDRVKRLETDLAEHDHNDIGPVVMESGPDEKWYLSADKERVYHVLGSMEVECHAIKGNYSCYVCNHTANSVAGNLNLGEIDEKDARILIHAARADTAEKKLREATGG